MQSGGEKREVNGDPTVSQYGFVTCRYCGKAPHPCSHGNEEEQHYRFCNHANISFGEDIGEKYSSHSTFIATFRQKLSRYCPPSK